MSRTLISIATGLGGCVGTVLFTCYTQDARAIPFCTIVTSIATTVLGLKALKASKEEEENKELLTRDYIIIGTSSFIGSVTGGAVLAAMFVATCVVSSGAFVGAFFGSALGNAVSMPFSLFARRHSYYY